MSEHTKEKWEITGRDEMEGIEIGMRNKDGTICPLVKVTWYGEDDCNAEEDEARAKRLVLCWNSHDALLAACKRHRDIHYRIDGITNWRLNYPDMEAAIDSCT